MKKLHVFVSDHFNILHTGHIRLLQFAKEIGEYLIFGVESDQIAGDAFSGVTTFCIATK